LLLSPARTPLALAPAQPGTAPESLAGREQAVAWLEAEHRVMLALVAAAGAAGLDGHAWQLAWALASFLQWRGQVPAYIATQRAGDRPGEVRSRVGRGFVAARQEDYGTALEHAHAVLALRRADPAAGGLGEALSAVGWYYALSGAYARARRYREQALALERLSADPAAAAGPRTAWAISTTTSVTTTGPSPATARPSPCTGSAAASTRARWCSSTWATPAVRPGTRTRPGPPGRGRWTCWPARTPRRPGRSRPGCGN
jgi:tetratricopeptide (TPR) repeat protein